MDFTEVFPLISVLNWKGQRGKQYTKKEGTFFDILSQYVLAELI